MLWTRKTKIEPKRPSEALERLLATGRAQDVEEAEDARKEREKVLFEKLRALTEESPPGEGTVWVVDDDVAVQALLKSLFGREGYAVMSSSSVSEAMSSMSAAADCSLVVLDFNIPGGSGLDVLRELRLHSDSPVVMVSNIRRPELVAQAFELGANEFVEKPFDPRSLLVRARRLMD